ncbi:MAG TPA: SurA N-terminal domain-containing protein [Candidatus Acidoferrales bacterium]|nr:SurA N-terminal domain-containing protein [Candidatus Acidoferrales bacterium]
MKLCHSILPIVLACVLASCSKEVAPSPDVWAVVNGTQIMRQQVEKTYRSSMPADSPPPSQAEALSMKLRIVEELINTEILLQRAREVNLMATDAEVEQNFAKTKTPLSNDEFERKLQQSGLTVDDLKSEIRRRLSIQKLLNREVTAKINISDAQIAGFYGRNKSQFDLPEPEYHVAEIVITPNPNTPAHNRKNDKAISDATAGSKAAMLAKELTNGADFTQLAMDYSEDSSASTGGDLGYNPESSFSRSDPLLKHAVLSMKVGQVSAPLHLKDGRYVILKLLGKEPAGQRELSDVHVSEGIRQTLRNRDEELLRAAYLAETRNQAHIINYLAREILESGGKLPAD